MANTKKEHIEKMRVVEVFNEYVRHNGDLSKFASELAKKYSEEDGFTYTHTKITKYLNVTLENKKNDKTIGAAISMIEVKKNKRILNKGKKIYELYNANNGDWDKVLASLEDNPELTSETNGYALTLPGLKRYMKLYLETIRPKEVFDSYMKNNGNFSLFINGLCSRYSKEDGEPCTTSKITKYLKKYLTTRRLFKEEKEQLNNIDVLNKKRIIEIGEIIYYGYLKHNGNLEKAFAELKKDERVVDITSLEPLDLVGMKKYMREYMEYAREKEVFDEYIDHTGKYYEFAQELCEKYAKEDEAPKAYSVTKLVNYMNGYLNDAQRFTPEERAKYNKTLIEVVKRKYIVGGKFIEGFIHFNGDFNKIMEYYLGREKEVPFFRDDYTGGIITKSAIYDNVNFYLKNPNSPERVANYNIMKKLITSSSLRSMDIKTFFKFIEKVKNGESFESLRQFCDELGISKDSVKTIINAYTFAVDFDKSVEQTLNEFVKTAFKAEPKGNDKRNQAREDYIERSNLNKLECLKNLLEYYIQSDHRRITQVLMQEYGLTPSKFDRALSLAYENTSDVQLRALLDKYNAKLAFVENENRAIVNALYKFLSVGYIINGEYTKFNSYDFYKEFGKVDLADLKKSCYKYYNVADAERMVRWLRFVFGNQRIYKTPEELAKEVKFELNGLSLNDEEKLATAQYMESMGWPLSSSVYSDFIYRLLCGQVTLDVPEKEEKQTTKK